LVIVIPSFGIHSQLKNRGICPSVESSRSPVMIGTHLEGSQ
jgi:hypothetical protein